ncbi:uncharacterized protein LOC144724444 isoform X4 [Lampetra planeri]
MPTPCIVSGFFTNAAKLHHRESYSFDCLTGFIMAMLETWTISCKCGVERDGTDVSLLREESDGTGAGLAHGMRSALLLAEASLSPLRSGPDPCTQPISSFYFYHGQLPVWRVFSPLNSYVDVSDSKQYSSSVKMWTTDLSQTHILHRGPHALHTSRVSSEPQQRRLDVPACPLNDT